MRIVHWVLLALAGVAIVVALSGASSTTEWSASRVSGMCLLLLVLVWVIVARIQLGPAFSVTPQARQLVTTGLYKRIRNPIYCASPFLLIGLALSIARWWPLLMLIVVIPLQIVRARREAAILRATFGAVYEDYRRQTWF